MATVTGSQILARTLRQLDIDTMFYLMGGPMLAAESACIAQARSGQDGQHPDVRQPTTTGAAPACAAADPAASGEPHIWLGQWTGRRAYFRACGAREAQARSWTWA